MHISCFSQDYTADERRDLAKKSQAAPPVFGSEQRQALMRELHQKMQDALAKVRLAIVVRLPRVKGIRQACQFCRMARVPCQHPSVLLMRHPKSFLAPRLVICIWGFIRH